MGAQAMGGSSRVPPQRPTTQSPEAEEWLRRGYAEMAHTFERRPGDRAIRIMDVLISAAALALSAPVLVPAMIALRLTGGPALYRGLRVGRGGRVFTMYKLRTLPADAEQRLGPFIGPELTQLTEREVTRLGRVLRASKLDELPQLWNVLRGDMSLVGPRPIRPLFFAQLTEEIPACWQRIVVRPGLSGMAQLRVTREESWSDKLAHDLEYIADRSPALYMEVVLTTARLLLTRPLSRGGRDLRLP